MTLQETFKDDDGNEYQAEVETLDAVAFSPSPALAAAIAAGDVTTASRVVEAVSKDKDGNVVKVFRQSYTRCTAKNESGALALPGIDGDADKIWDFVSARADANVYQPVYVKLRNMSQGPEKAVAKMQKLFAGLSDAQKEAAKAALREAGVI